MGNQNKVSFWNKIDNRVIGFIVGMIVPFVTYFVVYFTQYGHLPFSEFYHLSKMENTAPLILRFMVFPNLIFFLIGNITKKFSFCWGVFYASILFIVPMLLIKFL
jgi:amino acid permease